MAELRRLLRRYRDSNELVCFSNIAREAALPWAEDEDFVPISDVFCDGVEIKLGLTPVNEVRRYRSELLNRICGAVADVDVKYLGFSERGHTSYLWLTLNSNSRDVDARFVDHLAKVAKSVREFVVRTWNLNEA
jgi:hypothetical protein